MPRKTVNSTKSNNKPKNLSACLTLSKIPIVDAIGRGLPVGDAAGRGGPGEVYAGVAEVVSL